MQFISGFYNQHIPEWNWMLENMKASAERFGHSVKIFPFPSIDPWLVEYPEIYQTICWKYKAIFMLEQLKMKREHLAWIDGDCLIVKRLDIEEIFSGCDLALTLRDTSETQATKTPLVNGYINLGVIFARNSDKCIDFFEQVREELLLSVFDQEAVNKAILRHSEMGEHGDILDIRGCKVKLLDCREYNFFYFNDDHSKARILHFKGIMRKFYEDFIH